MILAVLLVADESGSSGSSFQVVVAAKSDFVCVGALWERNLTRKFISKKAKTKLQGLLDALLGGVKSSCIVLRKIGGQYVRWSFIERVAARYNLLRVCFHHANNCFHYLAASPFLLSFSRALNAILSFAAELSRSKETNGSCSTQAQSIVVEMTVIQRGSGNVRNINQTVFMIKTVIRRSALTSAKRQVVVPSSRPWTAAKRCCLTHCFR